jgi:hypothetical protein
LEAAGTSDRRASCVIMHINKVHHVTTINRVAEDLGHDEDWLKDVANEWTSSGFTASVKTL